MKATEIIEQLQNLIRENGKDVEVHVRGNSNGTFCRCSNVRMGKSPITKNYICLTGGYRT